MSTPEQSTQPTQDEPRHSVGMATTVDDKAPARDEPARLAVPGFEVIEVLGRGGMGVVYKARQVSLGRLVALKMLLAGATADADESARFKAEAEAVARLQHPNIVQIFDVGQHEGRDFFSLEFVPGGTLAHKLAGTPLPPREAAGLVEQLANTIQYAHERNILHRDLKPSNILLTNEGAPKIADFGLAKKLDTDDGRTRTGAVIGTPSYMAPEQAWGMGKFVGPRVDIYALGAILYECLTGRPPFKGATLIETLEQVRTREPVPPRALNPAVPRDLETICLKCLAKEPAGRYLTARDLALDLRRFLDGEPVTARPLGALGRVWRSARRHPTATLATVLTVLTLLLGVGGGVAVWLYQASESARRTEASLRTKAEEAEGIAREAKTRAEDLATRLERVLYLQRVQAALREWERSDILRARALLDDCPPALRGWEWHYTRRLLWPVREIPGMAGALENVAFLPDGKRILSAAVLDGLRVSDARSGAELFFLEGTERRAQPGGGMRFGGYNPMPFAILPERGEIISTSQGNRTLEAWSLQTGKRIRTVSPGSEIPRTRIAYAPDGRWLASSFYGSNVAVNPPPILLVDLITGKELPRLEGHTSIPRALAASADGNLLASLGTNGEAFLWDMKAFKLLRRFADVPPDLVALTFAPDGSALYACGENGTVRAWDMPAATLKASLSLGPFKLTSLAFRSDGKMLACGTSAGEVVLFDPYNKKREALYRGHLLPHATVTTLAFSPDGTRIVSAGGDSILRLWDVTQRQEFERRSISLAGGSAVALDHRGRFLLAGSHNGSVRLWNLPEGSPGKPTAPVPFVWQVVPARVAPRAAIVSQAERAWSLRVWDWQADRNVLELPDLANTIESVALSDDGKHLFAIGTASGRQFLRGWDVDSAREVPLPFSSDRTLVNLAISPDGTLLATRTDASVRTDKGILSVRSLADGEERFNYRAAGSANALRFSSDGKMLACAVPGGVCVWSTETWREILRGTTNDDPNHLAFSPDGTRLATASTVVAVWDLISGQEALTLPGSGRVTALAFDERQNLIAADTDGSLLFWRGAPQ
jgi:WD40 repeat protein